MLDLLYKRRSIRKFKNLRVEKEKIDEIIEGTLLAPSGRNKKPWHFVVVTNKEIIKKLAESKSTGAQLVEEAPLVIVVFGDKEATTWVEDTSITLTYMHLLATNLDLGSCWVQLRDRVTKDEKSTNEYVKKLLDIKEDNLEVEAMMAIGYADEEKSKRTKDDLSFDKVKYID